MAARKLTPYNSILCADADTTKVQQLKKRFGSDKGIVIKQADASDMAWVKDSSVDKMGCVDFGSPGLDPSTRTTAFGRVIASGFRPTHGAQFTRKARKSKIASWQI